MFDVSSMRNELIKKLPQQVQRQKPLLRDASYDDIGDWLGKDVVDSDVQLVTEYFELIHIWYRNSYSSSGLSSSPNEEILAISIRAAISSFLFEIPIYDFHPKNLGRYDFDAYGKLLAQILATGWKDEAELVARLGFKELNRLLDRGISYGRLCWFMLELARDWLQANVSLDSEFRQHEIENLGIWDKLLAGWREPNERIFDSLVNEMAEYHTSQSKNAEMSENEWYEFEDMAYWLFPVELLAVLRLREWAGIANPKLSHPLFAVTPLATLYPTPAWPKDEVLDQAEAKFRSLYPNTPSVADLATLRAEHKAG